MSDFRPPDPECAWCGSDHPDLRYLPSRWWPNRRDEIFCCPSHRTASNRALKQFERARGEHPMITHKQAVLLAIIEEQTLGAYEIAVEYARRMKMETNHAWPYFDSTVAQLHLLWGAGLVRYQAIDKGGIGYHNYTAYTATLAGFDNLFQFRQTLGITPREDTHAPSECGDESKTASGIYRCTLAQGHEGGHHDHLDDGVGWSK